MEAVRTPEPCACPIKPIGPSMADSCGSSLVLFMTILQAFIKGRCDLADPCNRLEESTELEEGYDFVVVGGGTAGSVVAGRLSENSAWKVLVIEAGGDEPIQSSVPAFVTSFWGNNATDWSYYTDKQERACLDQNGTCYWPRGKMLGGSSVINGMMYMRGHAADYDGWAVNGAAGWSWAEVLPYFLKSEDNKDITKGISAEHHARGGPLPVQKFRWAPKFAHDLVSASIELGYPPTTDLNGETVTGFTIAQAMNDGGSRYSTARAFLRPGAHRKNLHVLYNALVSRLIVDPVDKRVTAVEYIKDGQTKTVGVKKEAILSGGSINSPQILQLSGIGPKQILDKFSVPIVQELPGVGQNLQNHVGVDLQFILEKEPDTDVLNWATAMDYLLERVGPMSSTSMSQLTGIINSKYAPSGGRHPDLQFFFGGYYASCSSGAITDQRQLNASSPRRSISISAINIQPRSRGYLAIRSTDPTQHPSLQPNYYYEPRDIDVVVEGAKIALALANTTIMREKYGMTLAPGYGEDCGDSKQHTDAYLKCLAMRHTAPENHQVGTCKMGPKSDPMAVVDVQLKVHGIKGLRVVDASVMPVVVTGNTAAATIMIGERGADFIKKEYEAGFDDGFGSSSDEGYHYNNADANFNLPSSQQHHNPWFKSWRPQWQTKDH